MESNWRFNVWDFGLSDLGIRLISSRVHPGPLSFMVASFNNGITIDWIESTVPAPISLVDFVLIQEDTPLHFPFGREVFPD